VSGESYAALIRVSPVILGSGQPLFRKGISSGKLALVSSQQLSSGGVILTYTKKETGN
jgi:hypothetical protein